MQNRLARIIIYFNYFRKFQLIVELKEEDEHFLFNDLLKKLELILFKIIPVY